MNPGLSCLVFLIDATLVIILGWQSYCVLEDRCQGLIETTLGWILLGVIWIVGAGVILGLTGALGALGFLIFHAASCVLFSLLQKNRREDVARAKAVVSDWRRFLSGHSPESFIAVALIIGLVLLTCLAAQAEPAVFDALTYRLSRVGQWLQDGRIASYATDDPRINYMPVGPDLVIAWLLGATDEGFLLAPLSQVFGGVLLMGATFGLARSVGFSRLASFGAISLLLGMANVAVQFTTIQSDLFTAGVFSASYLLWHRAVERNKNSVIGAIGIALAWGSKGTMFYMAPGLAIWVACHIWWHRSAWRTMCPAVVAGFVALLLFSGPSYWRNIATYRSLFGPEDAVLLHHGPQLGLRERLEKLELNLKTSAVQLLDPSTQPFWCRAALRNLGQKLLPALPETDDPYLFLHNFPRRYLGEGILQQAGIDGDVASCGVLVPFFFLAGGIAAWWRREPHSVQVAIWSLGVCVYFLVQHGLVQWHQWAFRFAILAAPWMAVAGSYAINSVNPRWRPVIWLIAVVSCGEVTWRSQVEPHQGAWKSWRNPDEGMPQFVYSHWHAWAERLGDQDSSMRLALPINSPLAALYRTKTAHHLTMEKLSVLNDATAEKALGGGTGWLIVPAVKFIGREGSVMGYTFLYGGEGGNALSLAAYRALRAGETPRSIIYRASRELTPTSLHRSMIVRSWKSEAKLDMQNPDASPWRYSVKTAMQELAGVLQANETISLPLKISDREINEIAIEFRLASPGVSSGIYPGAIFVNP